jgi:glycosyltransferase involved in cell wall biosynthesis
LVIADPHIPVPPQVYGGVERIVANLCKGLSQLGHKVHLLAAPGSGDYGGGLTTHRPPGRSLASRAYRKLLFRRLAASAAREADLVINFGRLDYFAGLLHGRQPLICWFQNPVPQSEIDYVLARRPDVASITFVGVSHSQIDGLETAGRARVIHNVADTDILTFRAQPDTPPYVAFLGRLTRNKGVHLAIAAARSAGVRLVIAGNVSQEAGGEKYFETEVRPHLGAGCEWIGPVNDEQKAVLLGGATALLFPAQWKEPFALVVPESLACGTPVIAWNIASTPEAVREGKTGYLCRSLEEMVVAIGKVCSGEIDRRVCRYDAEARFSPDRLVESCLAVCAELLARPSSRPPRAASLEAPAFSSVTGLEVRSRRFLLIADPHIPVPPVTYGGAERAVALLGEGLTASGHRVDLMAGIGSRPFPGGRLWVHRAPGIGRVVRAWSKTAFVIRSFLAASRADVVINFGRLDYLHGILLRKRPLLLRFGNPLDQNQINWMGLRRQKQVQLVGVSRDQVADLNARIEVIYNAVNTMQFPFSAQPAEPRYVAFLGRLTRNKGVHLAIEAARRANRPLRIGGNISGETGGQEYFERYVKPALGPGCEWLGELDDVGKMALLSGAEALLFPVQWREPFANVLVESLACGTPVIAWRIASTPEAIRHGQTGFLCDSVEEMAAAIGQIGTIDRRACRADVEARFSQETQVAEYLRLIERMLTSDE